MFPPSVLESSVVVVKDTPFYFQWAAKIETIATESISYFLTLDSEEQKRLVCAVCEL
jgi:hypothetical protein